MAASAATKLSDPDDPDAWAQLAREQITIPLFGEVDPRSAVLLVGTGVSRGMMREGTAEEVLELCDWGKMVEALVAKLPAGCDETRAIRAAKAAVEPAGNGGGNGSEGTHVLLAMAHMVRAKLDEEGRWSSEMGVIVETIEAAYDPGSEWAKLFAELNPGSGGDEPSGAAEPPLQMPLVFTTNYDNLLATALSARVVINLDHPQTSGKDARGVGEASKEAGYRLLPRPQAEEDVPAYLKGIPEASLLWEMQRKGALACDDAFVHHIHGAGTHPETIIFDPADYERAVRCGALKELAGVIAPKGHPIIVLGMGDGMFDRNLRALWVRLSLEQRSRAPSLSVSLPGGTRGACPLVYWLVPECEREARQERLKKEIGRGLSCSLIRIVSSEGFQWQPDWVRKVFSY